MATALDVNWEEIRQRYESGTSVDTLAEEFGVKTDTIYQRKSRGGWKPPFARTARKHTITAIKREIAAQVQVASPVIAEAVKKWTDKAHLVAERIVERVSESAKLSHEPEDLQRLAGALDRADTVGRRALGLDREDAGPTVTNISIGLVYAANSQAPGGLLMDYADTPRENALEAEVVSETRT